MKPLLMLLLLAACVTAVPPESVTDVTDSSRPQNCRDVGPLLLGSISEAPRAVGAWGANAYQITATGTHPDGRSYVRVNALRCDFTVMFDPSDSDPRWETLLSVLDTEFQVDARSIGTTSEGTKIAWIRVNEPGRERDSMDRIEFDCQARRLRILETISGPEDKRTVEREPQWFTPTPTSVRETVFEHACTRLSL